MIDLYFMTNANVYKVPIMLEEIGEDSTRLQSNSPTNNGCSANIRLLTPISLFSAAADRGSPLKRRRRWI
jgi:hypothetical protein